MKKKIFLIIMFFLILMGTFSACNEEVDIGKAYPIKDGRFDINENEFITMQLLPEEGTNNSSHISRLENHTKGLLQYGRQFSLEYYNKNNTDEGPIYLYSLAKEYNKGKKGSYRKTHCFSVAYDFPNNGRNTSEDDYEMVIFDSSNSELIENTQESVNSNRTDDTKNFSFTIFPNPTGDFVTVNYSLYDNAPIGIELFNLFGQRIKVIAESKPTAGRLQCANISCRLENGNLFYKGSLRKSGGI